MKRRNNLIKVIVFIILSGLVVYFFINKNETKPVDQGTPGDVPNVEEPKKNDEIPEVIDTGTYLNKIIYTKALDKSVEEVIIKYMDLYYKSMKELESYDMSELFSNSEQAYVNQTAVDLLVSIRKLKPTDLTLYSAKYDLDIKEVTKVSGGIKVVLRESNYLRFNFMKDIESRVYNIENTFVIDDNLKISSYDKVQDFFVMVTDKYTKTSDYKASLDKIKSDYLSLTKTKVNGLKKDYDNFLNNGIKTVTCDHDYDRNKALEYAKKWVNKRNEEWTTFDANCQNFASQVVYTGGVPMDHTGSADNFMQWKFYDSTYKEAQVESGYVYTWTSVSRFSYYVKNNTGSGICATYDDNLYYAEAGDVIQVGTINSLRHALVSIGPYKVDGKVVDIMVNSNTVDLENYPMSAYVYPYTSLIKVYGWND